MYSLSERVILKDGEPMTLEAVLADLKRYRNYPLLPPYGKWYEVIVDAKRAIRDEQTERYTLNACENLLTLRHVLDVCFGGNDSCSLDDRVLVFSKFDVYSYVELLSGLWFNSLISERHFGSDFALTFLVDDKIPENTLVAAVYETWNAVWHTHRLHGFTIDY